MDRYLLRHLNWLEEVCPLEERKCTPYPVSILTAWIFRALLAELDDPFTRFLEPSRYAALKRGTAGSLTGVGLEVGFDMGAGSDSDLVVSSTASHTRT